MEGIQFVVDDKNRRKAVIIDLDVYGKLWEDIHDLLVLESRAAEPRSNWAEVKKRLPKD